jgi:hypothetical protein
MKIRFNVFGFRCSFAFDCRKLKTEYVKGYTNRCKYGKYIIFLDYDKIKLKWLRHEIDRLQEEFYLGDFYIFESSDDCYHAVCFDKITFKEFLTVLERTSVDQNYKIVPVKYGHKLWTLRVSDKKNRSIKYLECIPSKYEELNTKSYAHMRILSNLYKKLNVSYIQNHDNCKDLILSRYPI